VWSRGDHLLDGAAGMCDGGEVPGPQVDTHGAFTAVTRVVAHTDAYPDSVIPAPTRFTYPALADFPARLTQEFLCPDSTAGLRWERQDLPDHNELARVDLS